MVSVFDVDHTLVRRSTGEYFLFSAIRHGILPWQILLRVPLFLWKYRYGSLGDELVNKGVGPLEGLPVERLEEVAAYAFEKHIKKAVYSEMQKLVDNLLKKGAHVVLATSSIDFVVAPLAAYLGITEIVASKLEVKEGLCTGRFSAPAVFGKEKLTRVETYLSGKGFSLNEAAFYSDSIHDAPLLERVGHPVVVNPDNRLRNLAKKNAWDILYCGS